MDLQRLILTSKKYRSNSLTINQHHENYNTEVTFLIFVLLFGVVLNGVLFVSIISAKGSSQSTLYLFIANLNLVQILIYVVFTPLYITSILLKLEHVNELYCNKIQPCHLILQGVALTSKLIIALHIHSLMGTSYKSVASNIRIFRRPITKLIIIWTINILLIVLPVFYMNWTIQIIPDNYLCLNESIELNGTSVTESNYSAKYFKLSLLLFYIGEFVVAYICMMKVIKTINSAKRLKQRRGNCPSPAEILPFNQGLRTAVLFFITFLIIWCPTCVLNIIDRSHTKVHLAIHHVSLDLTLLQGIIEPCIFLYGLRKMRQYVERCMTCQCKASENGQNRGRIPLCERSNPGVCTTIVNDVRTQEMKINNNLCPVADTPL